MRRRYLLPAALVTFVAAVGVLFAASGARSGAQSPGQAGTTPSTLPVGGGRGAAGSVSVPTPPPTEPTVALPSRLIPEGRTLFLANCSSCHGDDAAGSDRAPNLVGLGTATVDFWVSTGRMPLTNPSAQATIKPPRFNERQTHSIAAFVHSLGPGGPGIPALDLRNASQSRGFEVYSDNCAPCHTITGVGDALSAGTYAPSLYQATPTQVAEAVRIGPGQMPRFGIPTISTKQLNDLVSYVGYLHSPNDAGGGGLGHVGPVTEGFVALLVGLGALMLVSFWIGDRS